MQRRPILRLRSILRLSPGLRTTAARVGCFASAHIWSSCGHRRPVCAALRADAKSYLPGASVGAHNQVMEGGKQAL